MGEVLDLPGSGERRGVQWVSYAVVAAEFGVTRRTVERWRAAGCPCLVAGGVVRFRLGEVEAWLRGR